MLCTLPFRRVKESSLTRWQAVKKEVAFRRGDLVGVRGYGRERISGKQRKPLQRKGSISGILLEDLFGES